MDDVVVKAADMADEMQALVIEICRAALTQYTKESEVAAYIKKNIDTRDSPTWQCIVGISFGSYVAHSRDHFLHLKIKAPNVQGFCDIPGCEEKWCYILLFKTR